jgi:hypothetical protein
MRRAVSDQALRNESDQVVTRSDGIDILSLFDNTSEFDDHGSDLQLQLMSELAIADGRPHPCWRTDHASNVLSRQQLGSESMVRGDAERVVSMYGRDARSMHPPRRLSDATDKFGSSFKGLRPYFCRAVVGARRLSCREQNDGSAAS